MVEVTFDIDANGIINVSASDSRTGNEQKIRIEGGSGLNEDEVQRMISGGRGRTPTRRTSCASSGRTEHRRAACVPDRANAQGAPRDPRRGRGSHDRGSRHGAEGSARRLGRERDQAEDRGAAGGLHKLAEAVYAQATAQQQQGFGGNGTVGWTTRSSRTPTTRSSTKRRRRPRNVEDIENSEEELVEEIDETEALRAENEELIDTLQRVKAEFDNYRAGGARSGEPGRARPRAAGQGALARPRRPRTRSALQSSTRRRSSKTAFGSCIAPWPRRWREAWPRSQTEGSSTLTSTRRCSRSRPRPRRGP